jgi:DNA-binding NarL/FixJ family response regulator
MPRGDSDFRTGLPERAQPSEDESLLVSLLAAGLTDAAISRATGMGQRTVQRKVHLLMEAMGVTTRFQAGAAAYELGWLDPGTRRPVSVGQ